MLGASGAIEYCHRRGYRVIRPLQTADLAVRIYVVHTAIQSLMTPAEFNAFRAFLEPKPEDEPESTDQSVPGGCS